MIFNRQRKFNCILKYLPIIAFSSVVFFIFLDSWLQLKRYFNSFMADMICSLIIKLSIFIIILLAIPSTKNVSKTEWLLEIFHSQSSPMYVAMVNKYLERSQCHLYTDDVKWFASRNRKQIDNLIGDMQVLGIEGCCQLVGAEWPKP